MNENYLVNKITKKLDTTNTLLFLLMWTVGFKLMFTVWEYTLMSTMAKAGYTLIYMGGLLIYIYKVRKEMKK